MTPLRVTIELMLLFDFNGHFGLNNDLLRNMLQFERTANANASINGIEKYRVIDCLSFEYLFASNVCNNETRMVFVTDQNYHEIYVNDE